MCRAPARNLCSWIDNHIERFRPATNAGLPRFRDVKPVGELVLILYALAGPRHRAARSEFLPWAERVAETLWPDLEILSARYPWGKSDSRAFGAYILPVLSVLELLTGIPFSCRGEVEKTLRAEPDFLELAFARDMADLDDCRPNAQAVLASEIAGWKPAPSLPSLYRVTHAVFFATKFGRRSGNWPAEQQAFVRSRLGPCVTARLATGHFDITAELLAAMAWAGSEAAPEFQTGIAALAAIAEAEGSIPTDPRPSTDDPFTNCYHATLVTLAALAEAALSP